MWENAQETKKREKSETERKIIHQMKMRTVNMEDDEGEGFLADYSNEN